MENGKFVSSDKGLERALEQVRTNRDEAAKFAADPQAYLGSRGVSTEGLRFGGAAELSEAELEQVAGGALQQIGICASAGCVVCVTVGS